MIKLFSLSIRPIKSLCSYIFSSPLERRLKHVAETEIAKAAEHLSNSGTKNVSIHITVKQPRSRVKTVRNCILLGGALWYFLGEKNTPSEKTAALKSPLYHVLISPLLLNTVKKQSKEKTGSGLFGKLPHPQGIVHFFLDTAHTAKNTALDLFTSFVSNKAELAAKKHQVQELTQKNALKEKEIEALAQSNSELKKENRALTRTLSTLGGDVKKIAVAVADIELARKKASSAEQQELKALKTSVDRIVGEQRKIETRLSSLPKTINGEAEKKIFLVKQTVLEETGKLRDMTKLLEKRVETSSQSTEEMLRSTAEYQNENIQSLRSDANEQTYAVNNLSKKVASLEAEVTSLKTEIEKEKNKSLLEKIGLDIKMRGSEGLTKNV